MPEGRLLKSISVLLFGRVLLLCRVFIVVVEMSAHVGY